MVPQSNRYFRREWYATPERGIRIRESRKPKVRRSELRIKGLTFKSRTLVRKL